MSDEEIIARIERLSSKEESSAKLENRILTSIVMLLIGLVGFFGSMMISDIKTSIKDGNTEVRGDLKSVWVKLNETAIQCTTTQQQVVDHIKTDEQMYLKQTK